VIREVTDYFGHAEIEPVFDAWQWRLSQCIQIKDESIAEGKSKSRGENPYSHRQTEKLKNDRRLHRIFSSQFFVKEPQARRLSNPGIAQSASRN
jgi:hypothetical protein